MSQIKKIFLVLAILALILPIGVEAQSGGFSIDSQGNWGLSIGSGSRGGIGSMGGLGLPGGTIYDIIGNLTYWLLGIFAFFGIIGFVVSGIMYLVSAGNDDMISKAKKYMMYSIVGVIVGLMGFVVLQAAQSMLEGSFF